MMTRFRGSLVLLLSLFLVAVILPAAMAGEWRGSGTPLYTIASGSLHGGVHVSGGHGLTYADPYTEYFDLPDNIIYARMYVPMWNYNKGDTLTVSINDNELKTREEPDYIAAWGVCCYAYDVTGVAFKKGINTISATYDNNNGAPYGIFLAAVYEDKDMPYTQFWIDEGNYALNKAVAYGGTKDQMEAVFPGAVKTETVEKADLWTVMIAGTGGEIDELWFNSKLLGKDVGRAKTGGYLDFDQFNVSGELISHNNTAIFKRGDEQYLHPFNAVLVLEHNSDVKGDKELTGFETKSSIKSIIPVPVIAVLVIAIIGFFLIYMKKKRERG
ncbi:MAG: DUF3344 domain-containing protein [Methanosarcinales archaeon]|nr:MAG: DUF3344 domain-containing protein [Methanosarcinales archaeon]